MVQHKHVWTKWHYVDLEHIIQYKMCKKCGKVEFKGNYANWTKRYS